MSAEARTGAGEFWSSGDAGYQGEITGDAETDTGDLTTDSATFISLKISY